MLNFFLFVFYFIIHMLVFYYFLSNLIIYMIVKYQNFKILINYNFNINCNITHNNCIVKIILILNLIKLIYFIFYFQIIWFMYILIQTNLMKMLQINLISDFHYIQITIKLIWIKLICALQIKLIILFSILN